ncbi:MAG: excisionase family DNA-binding protein [Bacteroidota bacterium]
MKSINEILQRVKNIESKLSENREPPLSTEEAAAYLKLPIDTFYKKTHKKEISFFRAGKRNYFKREDLDTYLFKNRISSLDEIEQEVANSINLSSKY